MWLVAANDVKMKWRLEENNLLAACNVKKKRRTMYRIISEESESGGENGEKQKKANRRKHAMAIESVTAWPAGENIGMFENNESWRQLKREGNLMASAAIIYGKNLA